MDPSGSALHVCVRRRSAHLARGLRADLGVQLDEARNHLGHAHCAAAGAVEHHPGLLQRRLLRLHAVDEPARAARAGSAVLLTDGLADKHCPPCPVLRRRYCSCSYSVKTPLKPCTVVRLTVMALPTLQQEPTRVRTHARRFAWEVFSRRHVKKARHTAVRAAVPHLQRNVLTASLVQHRCDTTPTGAKPSRPRLAHPVVTTAPVPWMSSLKQSSLSRRRCRMVNARSVWKSARAHKLQGQNLLMHHSAWHEAAQGMKGPSSWHKRPVCITARCIGPGPASTRLKPWSVACSGRRGGGTRTLKLHEAVRPLVVHGHAELLDRGEGLLLAQPLLLAALQWRSTT